MYGSFSKLPGGNIHPSRFVKLQTDNTVVEAGSGDAPWGISQASTRALALTADTGGLSGLDDGYCGVANGPPINIFGPGDDQCKLELGGTVTIGAYLKASTNGVGVAATTDKDRVGAVALEAGSSGDVVLVKPLRFDVSV